MSDYAEQKAALQERIGKVNADIAAERQRTNNLGMSNENNTPNLDLGNRLKAAQKQLADLEEHHAVMNGHLGTVLKNNGLDDNIPNNPAYVDERLKQEMFKAANANDMETYKHLRNQRKKLKEGQSPGGTLIGNNPRNISQ